MALGTTQLENISSSQETIKNQLIEMRDCWNTFQYVAKGLSDWESDTVIGSEVASDMRLLSECLEETLSGINQLNDVINKFVERQRQLNK